MSKYIGETEKNLDRLFNQARSADAVLFFDEADALFGKRTEVKDAHDRYANLEVGYLLQKIEEFDGLAMFAANMRGNMHEAFTRRLRAIVEFPFPDEAQRALIWRAAIPRLWPMTWTSPCWRATCGWRAATSATSRWLRPSWRLPNTAPSISLTC